MSGCKGSDCAIAAQNAALPEADRRLAAQEAQHLLESIKDNDAEESQLQVCTAGHGLVLRRAWLRLLCSACCRSATWLPRPCRFAEEQLVVSSTATRRRMLV